MERSGGTARGRAWGLFSRRGPGASPLAALEIANTVHLIIMSFKFFTVPIQDSGTAETELNGFLRSHRVLSVDRRWVEQGASSFWSFCIDYLEHASGGPGQSRAGSPPRGKVDYKDVLSPEEFAVFARLREVRKEIAAVEAVPVYTIFTNEQLAQMVQAKAADRAALEKISGVGDARIEKYGARMLEVLSRAWAGTTNEAGRKPV